MASPQSPEQSIVAIGKEQLRVPQGNGTILLVTIPRPLDKVVASVRKAVQASSRSDHKTKKAIQHVHHDIRLVKMDIKRHGVVIQDELHVAVQTPEHAHAASLDPFSLYHHTSPLQEVCGGPLSYEDIEMTAMPSKLDYDSEPDFEYTSGANVFACENRLEEEQENSQAATRCSAELTSTLHKRIEEQETESQDHYLTDPMESSLRTLRPTKLPPTDISPKERPSTVESVYQFGAGFDFGETGGDLQGLCKG
ncbi:uncharacterized protein EI97DRAFT_439967 [Westerdykella ornata]|uniref:Uncharacterized protein n=1 Tax=Westerdykella ornata TaxID=318751 RepID=A0A6A6JSW2_WESOR|nr:uncharacterized protein EI97DRAFT_439967 [Westerdykella ornata]KAF2279652.1 hypothetical protein EI97DRAFT_439967 [Westerdykella ornata]